MTVIVSGYYKVHILQTTYNYNWFNFTKIDNLNDVLVANH